MILKDITKKIPRIFFSFLFVFLVPFFVLPINDAFALCTKVNPTVEFIPIVGGDTVSGDIGNPFNYTIRVTNTDTDDGFVPLCGPFVRYDFSIAPIAVGLNLESHSLPLAVNVFTGASTNTPFTVTSKLAGLVPGNYNFIVTATDSMDITKTASVGGTYNIVCINKDPIVTITPNSLSGLAGQAQTYVISVKNDDSVACADRTFTLSLSGLTPCVPGWTDDLEVNTGSLDGQETYTKNVVISSCASSVPGTNTFTISAIEGANSGNDLADFVITVTPTENCAVVGDEDGDGDSDCLDSDCLGVAPCCGDGLVTGSEACDISGNLGCVGSEICAGCFSCVGSSTAGECPVGFDDCDCDGVCEMDVSSDPLNCGKCGNVCPGNYCNSGSCVPVTGGFVPCGRMYDNSNTIWNEQESCKICHIVPLIDSVIEYLLGIVALITVLSIVIGGVLYVSSAGDASRVTIAKTAVIKSLYGFVFVLVAWVVVNIGMVIFGFDDPFGDGSWAKFNCDFITSPINHYCGDGLVDNPNSDGMVEMCDPKETKIDFIARTGLSAEDWVETIYACNPTNCDSGCALDPLVGQIGEGCYQPNLSGGGLGTPCQKGRYICDFDTDTVICQNTYNDASYRLAGSYCVDIYDECCVDGGAALPTMTFDIIRLPTTNITSCVDWDCYWPGHQDGICTCPAGYSCDDICKNNGGKVCVGVGLMDVSAYHCISLKDNFGTASCSGDHQCNNSANLLTNDCRAEFYTTIWTCDECSDVSPIDGIPEAYDFSVGETACYCM